jgi:hypothetical protein
MFAQLADEDQAYIRSRIQELQDYLGYWDKLVRVQAELGAARSVEELERLDSQLRRELALPSSYQAEWAQTEAAELYAKLRQESETLLTALSEVEKWYRRRASEGEALWTFSRGKPADAPSWNQWLKETNDVLTRMFPAQVLGPTGLTLDIAAQFDRVDRARKDWERFEPRLKRLRDTVAALGLAGPSAAGDRAPLDIPDGFAVGDAHRYVQQLRTQYPGILNPPDPADLPAAATEELRRAARLSYEHLLDAGRKAVLEHLQQDSPNERETPELWRGLAVWLNNPEELRDWRVLATWLVRFQNPQAKDPVTSLADFLRHERFELDVKTLTLEVPTERRIRPTGPLTVFLSSGGNPPAPANIFKLTDDEGRRDLERQVTVFTFRRESGGMIDYRLGNGFFAGLPVKKDRDPADWLLTWAKVRSDMYQFESLARPPRLHRRDQENTQGELVETISLSVTPASGLPRVPDLVPVVRLKKR